MGRCVRAMDRHSNIVSPKLNYGRILVIVSRIREFEGLESFFLRIAL